MWTLPHCASLAAAAHDIDASKSAVVEPPRLGLAISERLRVGQFVGDKLQSQNKIGTSTEVVPG
eukprot:11575997-Karenia_brevis.AAC.1